MRDLVIAKGYIDRSDRLKLPDKLGRDIRALLVGIEQIAGNQDQIRLLGSDLPDQSCVVRSEDAVVQITEMYDAQGFTQLPALVNEEEKSERWNLSLGRA